MADGNIQRKETLLFFNKTEEQQPGDGVVSIMYLKGKRRKRYQSRKAKSYNTLINDLIQVKTSSKTFAKVIQKLFKDSSEITQRDTAIAEMYFLLLFEIARRGSNKEDKTDEGKRLDELPIGSAIVGIIKLLDATDKKQGPERLNEILESFCHCFKGHASAREKTIIN